MNLSEIAKLLGYRREDVRDAIVAGIETPISKTKVFLRATQDGPDFDVLDADLDVFIAAFDGDEPGRHPPTHVRRTLLVEAGHKCGICRADAPPQFHHIIEWSKIKHYDPEFMLAVCGTCHTKINAGQIDPQAQRLYKQRLRGGQANDVFATSKTGPLRFQWQDIAAVITGVRDAVVTKAKADMPADLTSMDLETKNELNRLSSEYFDEMRTLHEPHFHRFTEFLKAPENGAMRDKYDEIVDELRTQLARHRTQYGPFEEVLRDLYETTICAAPSAFQGNRRVLNAFFSFMYFNCDLGEKQK